MIEASRRKKTPVRFRQLERTLIVLELLAPLRHGATVDQITREVNEILGTRYVHGTLARDLAGLAQLGLVESVRSPDRGHRRTMQQYQWRFTDRSIRSTVMQRAGEIRGELRDAG